MAFDLEYYLRWNNARFVATLNGIFEQYNHPFEDDLLVSMENLTYNTSDGDESDADIVSVRRQLEHVHFQNPYVGDGKVQGKATVPVDVIVQDSARNIPKWITVAPQVSSECLHLALPVQELIGNQATACRKKVELSNDCSSSRPLQLQFDGVPFSPNTVTVLRHQPSPELNKSCYDSIFDEYQSADEECSWSNVTLADLYPRMVKVFTRLMTKQSRRTALKYIFGHLRHKRGHSKRPKLNVTVDKIRGFRPLKLKQAPSICRSRSEEIQKQILGNENRELCDDECSINNSTGLVPYSYIDTNEIKMDYSDSTLEHHLVSGKGQKVSEQTVFPSVTARMGETFIVEDELQTAVSLKNSKCKDSEKLSYKCSSEYHFIASTANSGSAALCLVKESQSPKINFPCGGTSEPCSSTCSSYGNSNPFTPVTNCPPARASNTLHINPETMISEREIFFQRKHSFSSLSVKQSPSKMHQKYEDAFEKLYHKLCSKEIQRPLTLTRPLSNLQNLEEEGRLVKSNLSNSAKFDTHYDREFDRIYEQLCSEPVPKLPGLRRASNLRKYEGIQMSETVNALVNSPVRTLFAVPRVKRPGNFQHDLLCSPVKRLNNIPESYFHSTKCQQFSHGKSINLQTVGKDFLSTSNGSNSSFFDSQNYRSQVSRFHAASDKHFLGTPGTSLQESGISDAHSAWPRAVKNYGYPGNAQKCHQRMKIIMDAWKSPS
ncbi:PREDICTED: uncharacterized protein LOC104536028 [Mesitornis unicolor]|uniref:uncharacterized protein LOC104536028 n=1 Tax=Mesitornis unicolor TaxID=54374 RepID=UPI0005295036|nr:PREDICTED: uncharacterized protein LOC104536028 [Mesitornis unicolor]